MELPGLHLAYCTNIHRGETWPETLAALEKHTLEVKRRVCPDKPYAIGLRLGVAAAQALADQQTRSDFRRWLDKNGCYVFTINGFPYGQFHGTRVKEQVFQPDWATPERSAYTRLLFEILADILPSGLSGRVSTLPGSHKELIRGPEHETAIRRELLGFSEWLARFSDQRGMDLHLGVEPEPLGYFENTAETLAFFDDLGPSEAVRRCLGVNYDTCHFALQYEEPDYALPALHSAGIRLSKLHLSSALRLHPDAVSLARLRDFQEDVYFHQTIARHIDGRLERHRDLPEALAAASARALTGESIGEEWRVHFHIPLHASPDACFQNTASHIDGTIRQMKLIPGLCSHLEMETYTWEVLPGELRSASVEDQLEKEYQWTLARLA